MTSKILKATALANANIALTKYWGKRDKALILPMNGSTSVSLNHLNTITTVEFSEKFKEDFITLNDEELKKDAADIVKHLDLIREMAGIKFKAKMISTSNFPIAAGLASSASGFAALSLAASKAAGLELNEKELSILARRGSGSASRSIPGGFVEWKKGEQADGLDSFAYSFASKDYWPEFRMLTTILTEAKKKWSSRSGMAQTVASCKLYKGWLDSVQEDIEGLKKAVLQKDFQTVGEIAEMNCLKMHATMISTNPPIIYWQPATISVIHSVLSWRDQGQKCFFTIDGGPNVKVICLAQDAKHLTKELLAVEGVKKVIECSPGDKAQLIEKHLF